MSLEDILLEFSTVVHGEVLMAVPRKRYDALAAELADWKRMRNEAMAQATFNRNEIDALAASVDRLTSDKARLASELAAEQESNTFLNNLHAINAERIRALEAALRKIGYEPIGHAEATEREVLQAIVDIARSALETKGEQDG